MDLNHAQYLKTRVTCSVGTHIMTPEDIDPVAYAVILQGELMAVEGPEEPKVLDLVLAASALPTTQLMFSSFGVSRQFQLLTAQPYYLQLIH